MDYDDWKTGLHDKDSPMNREEYKEEAPTYNSILEAYYSKDEDAFLEVVSEIQYNLDVLYHALDAIDNGLKGRVLSIIEKMK